MWLARPGLLGSKSTASIYISAFESGLSVLLPSACRTMKEISNVLILFFLFCSRSCLFLVGLHPKLCECSVWDQSKPRSSGKNQRSRPVAHTCFFCRSFVNLILNSRVLLFSCWLPLSCVTLNVGTMCFFVSCSLMHLCGCPLLSCSLPSGWQPGPGAAVTRSGSLRAHNFNSGSL